MPFAQYHDPAWALPAETRTFARVIMSLIEEAEAISWHEHRLAVEPDPRARSPSPSAWLPRSGAAIV